MARKKTSYSPNEAFGQKKSRKGLKTSTSQTIKNTDRKGTFWSKYTIHDLLACIVILFYVNVTRLGPREAFDVSTSRWQYLSMVNIGVLLYILLLKYLKGDETKRKINIYSNNIFYSFILMVTIAATSILHATNFGEAMINFGRLSAVFIVFVNIAYLLQERFHLIHLITKVLILYLCFDMFIYYGVHIHGYITMQDFPFSAPFRERISAWGYYPNDNEIKGVWEDSRVIVNQRTPEDPWHGGYANRNIFAAAIVLKIPFAFFGVMFYRGLWRWISSSAYITAIVALILLSTRSIILSMVLMNLAIIVGILYLNKLKILDKKFLKYILILLLTPILGVWIQNFYEKTYIKRSFQYSIEQKQQNGEDTSEVKTINTNPINFEKNTTVNRFNALINDLKVGQGSFSNRISGAKHSWKLFKENPILGVGIGNWKVDVLKYESRDAAQFVLMKHAHNDFIEYGTELGIFGLLAFIGVFFFSMLNFIKLSRSDLAPSIKILSLLSTVATVTYVPDALGNFPSERTELQVLLAFILAINTALYYHYQRITPNISVKLKLPVTYLHGVLIIVAISFYYFSNSMFDSSKHQKFAFRDYNSIHARGGEFKYKNYFKKPENQFPAYPSMDEICTPISVIKALYAINEKDNKKAINILMKDDQNPYHMRKEFLLADCYDKLGKPDSVIKYSNIVLEYKPLLQDNIILLVSTHNARKEYDESLKVLRKYLSLETKMINPWMLLINTFERKGEKDSVSFYLDSALKLFPNNENLIRRKYGQYIDVGNNAMRNRQYQKAIKNYTIILNQDISLLDVLQNRAFAYYSAKDYPNAIKDFSILIDKKPNETNYLYYRGLSNYFLKNMRLACDDISKLASMGHKESQRILPTICGAVKL